VNPPSVALAPDPDGVKVVEAAGAAAWVEVGVLAPPKTLATVAEAGDALPPKTLPDEAGETMLPACGGLTTPPAGVDTTTWEKKRTEIRDFK
jgi:hypothetical protein